MSDAFIQREQDELTRIQSSMDMREMIEFGPQIRRIQYLLMLLKKSNLSKQEKEKIVRDVNKATDKLEKQRASMGYATATPFKPTIKQIPADVRDKALMVKASSLHYDNNGDTASTQDFLNNNNIEYTIDEQLSNRNGLVLRNKNGPEVKFARRGTKIKPKIDAGDVQTDLAFIRGTESEDPSVQGFERQVDAVLSQGTNKADMEFIGYSKGGAEAHHMADVKGIDATSFNALIGRNQVAQGSTSAKHHAYRTTEDLPSLPLAFKDKNANWTTDHILPHKDSLNPEEAHKLDNFIDQKQRVDSSKIDDLMNKTVKANFRHGAVKRLIRDLQDSQMSSLQQSLEDNYPTMFDFEADEPPAQQTVTQPTRKTVTQPTRKTVTQPTRKTRAVRQNQEYNLPPKAKPRLQESEKSELKERLKSAQAELDLHNQTLQFGDLLEPGQKRIALKRKSTKESEIQSIKSQLADDEKQTQIEEAKPGVLSDLQHSILGTVKNQTEANARTSELGSLHSQIMENVRAQSKPNPKYKLSTNEEDIGGFFDEPPIVEPVRANTPRVTMPENLAASHKLFEDALSDNEVNEITNATHEGRSNILKRYEKEAREASRELDEHARIPHPEGESRTYSNEYIRSLHPVNLATGLGSNFVANHLVDTFDSKAFDKNGNWTGQSKFSSEEERSAASGALGGMIGAKAASFGKVGMFSAEGLSQGIAGGVANVASDATYKGVKRAGGSELAAETSAGGVGGASFVGTGKILNFAKNLFTPIAEGAIEGAEEGALEAPETEGASIVGGALIGAGLGAANTLLPDDPIKKGAAIGGTAGLYFVLQQLWVYLYL